jgi:hypothetical protein
MEEIMEQINIKKVGDIGMLVAGTILVYFAMSIYKTHLEIKSLKKQLNE